MSIEDRVKKIVSDQLGTSLDEIQSDSSFVDDLGADSLDTVELVMALEEEFDLEIADEDAEKISTVLANLLKPTTFLFGDAKMEQGNINYTDKMVVRMHEVYEANPTRESVDMLATELGLSLIHI